ncbi:MAG: hypothetical protein ABR544_03510, partial [Gammaproteobacteria bacterium]
MKFSIPSFKKKTGAAAPERGPRGGVSVKGVGIGLFLALLPLLLLPVVTLYWSATHSLQQADQRETRLAAEHFADRVAGWVAGQAHTLERLAADAELARLLDSGDREAWATRAEELERYFPQAMRVRLIEPGVQEVDMEATPPLSYAA